MIWAAIGINYKSNLYFIDGSLNEQTYIKMLEEDNIFQQLKEKQTEFIFQQDGATCHTTPGALNYLNKNARKKFWMAPKFS